MMRPVKIKYASSVLLYLSFCGLPLSELTDVILDLSKKKTDLKQCIENWNQLCRENSDSAVASILSFVLHVSSLELFSFFAKIVVQICGCSLSFPTPKINDDLNDPEFIKPFQKSIEDANASFGLL